MSQDLKHTDCLCRKCGRTKDHEAHSDTFVLGHSFEGGELASPSQRGNVFDEQYAVTVTGDGSITLVISQAKLHQTIHDLMCDCRKPWKLCTEGEGGVCNTVATLDDEEAWTHEYYQVPPPSRLSIMKRHIWLERGEDYTITAARITKGGLLAEGRSL